MEIPKDDIKERKDVVHLVNVFYKKMIDHKQIGHFFRDHMTIELEKHLPVMYDFWESVLFGQGAYKGNPILSHISLNKRAPLKPEDFEHWIQLWETTIDSNFQGHTSENAKKKARLMKDLMLFKINQSSDSNFIQ